MIFDDRSMNVSELEGTVVFVAINVKRLMNRPLVDEISAVAWTVLATPGRRLSRDSISTSYLHGPGLIGFFVIRVTVSVAAAYVADWSGSDRTEALSA